MGDKTDHENMEPKILIQFPTRQRPDKFIHVAKKYIDYLHDKQNYIMHISCDVDDFSMNNSLMIDKVYSLAPNGKIFLSFNENCNKIEAVNAGISDFDFDIILLASDDMIPRERGYDNIIRKYFGLYFPDFDGVVHFDDGHQHDRLNTLSILGKRYYDRFKYIYHSSYVSLWADNEFDEVSRILGKHQYIEQMIIKHEHPGANASVENDDLYLKNNSFELADRRNYQQRKAMNFNL
jgi:hypothetical protein